MLGFYRCSENTPSPSTKKTKMVYIKQPLNVPREHPQTSNINNRRPSLNYLATMICKTTILFLLAFAVAVSAEFCETSKHKKGQCVPDFVCDGLGFPSEDTDCPESPDAHLVCCEGLKGVPCQGKGPTKGEFGFCTAKNQCPGHNFLPNVKCGGAPFPAVVCCQRDIKCKVNGKKGLCVPGKFCKGTAFNKGCPGAPGTVCCVEKSEKCPCHCRTGDHAFRNAKEECKGKMNCKVQKCVKNHKKGFWCCNK